MGRDRTGNLGSTVAGYTLTIREGPKVEREQHDSLPDALDSLRARARTLQAGEELPEIKAFRSYGPERRVKARLEITAGNFLRRREAGLDVMGDGSLVPYRGGVFKRELDAGEGGDAPFSAIGEALGGPR
jgi:hypothetical protein